MDSEVIFRLVGVSFAYPGQTPALSGIDMELRSGERVALLGSNGSGKSTLLKLLDGLACPTQGTIDAFGTPLTEKSLQDEQFGRGFRRRVGFIFQRSDVQLFSPTVWDEIAFGPLQFGLPAEEVRQRVEDVIAMLDLHLLRDRVPFQLSGGEQKKVAIGSVLAVSPDVLLLDEPTASLDPRTQRWFLGLLNSLQAAGKTTVVATHDLDLLPALADRALVLGSDHTIQADAPVSVILSDHKLLHNANLAHHHLTSKDDGAVLEPAQLHGAHGHSQV